MAFRGVNKVILIGNLGADPEIRYMPSGEAWANIRLATSEAWKDKNTGQQQERTEWHRVVFYRRLAEIVGEYLKKGSRVYIEGRLQTRQWEKDGVKHYTTEIVGDEMQMLDRAGEASASAGPRQNSGGYAPSPAPAPSPRGGDQDRYYGAPEPAPARQPQQAPQYPDPAFNRHADDGFDDDIPF